MSIVCLPNLTKLILKVNQDEKHEHETAHRSNVWASTIKLPEKNFHIFQHLKYLTVIVAG